MVARKHTPRTVQREGAAAGGAVQATVDAQSTPGISTLVTKVRVVNSNSVIVDIHSDAIVVTKVRVVNSNILIASIVVTKLRVVNINSLIVAIDSCY